MSVTVRDIAKRLNIGKSTVGYALNGGPKPVSEEVRRQVLETAREMGYRPNENARSLARGRTNMIGVVPFQLQRGSLNSPFMRTALGAIYEAAEDAGRHVVLFTGYDPQDFESMRFRSFEARVDGVVLIAPQINLQMLHYVAEQNVPFAVVASPEQGPGVHFNADNRHGVRQAIDHLVARGHRDIGIINGNTESGDGKERYDAFLSAMVAHGLPVDPRYVAYGDFDVPSGYEAAQRLLARGHRPSAIFCANDQMAFGAFRACRELGLSVPHDISLIGFDDDELGSHLDPPLTTVRQPVAEMADAALKAVIAMAEGSPAHDQIFRTELIERGSVTSPKEDPS